MVRSCLRYPAVWLLVASLGAVAWAESSLRSRYESPALVAELLDDLESASERLERHSPAREALERGDHAAAREMLAFRPIDEAPLPEGFPAYTPVGVIEVKRYPAYRKAVGPGFWPLFQHIQTQGIPMTAPVEMVSETSVQGEGAMAFLYQNTEVGEIGPVDGVAVEDTPETVVASLGMRGRLNKEIAEGARQRLEAWHAEQSTYTRIGDGEESFRVFGFNGPMVRESERFWEMQMLLRSIQPGDAAGEE